jgi:hypothetical protein
VRRTLVLALALAAAAAAYLRFGRARVLDWNATADEAERVMPGDDVLPEAALETTRAITIDTGPEHIWPWLLQMGPRPRGGIYTYDWIERLLGIDIENTDEVLPEFQHLQPGEYLGLNDKGQGIQVVSVEDHRAIVLRWVPAGSTWTFALYPADGGSTRLISRNRLQGSGPLFRIGMVAVMEWASLIMERKMLLGIKERAEKLARMPADPAPAADGAARV